MMCRSLWRAGLAIAAFLMIGSVAAQEKPAPPLSPTAVQPPAGRGRGGSQTLNIAVPRLEKFAYVGVYSSGLIGAFGGGGGAAPAAPAAASAAPAVPSSPPGAGSAPASGLEWEQRHLAHLDNAASKKGLKLLWFATGVEDGLMPTTKGTVDLLKKHGFDPVFKETPGGHTWINWRSYLIEFVPQLFRP